MRVGWEQIVEFGDDGWGADREVDEGLEGKEGWGIGELSVLMKSADLALEILCDQERFQSWVKAVGLTGLFGA